MKRILIICLLISSAFRCLVAQSCITESIEFNTPGQLNNFAIDYPDCDTILGNVIIDLGQGSLGLDLSGLSQIVTIVGDLTIENNDHFTTLAGLENLNSVGGSLIINNNNELTSLAGLEGLEKISNASSTWDDPLNEGLIIGGNENLISLEGLNNVDTLSGVLRVTSNLNLESLTGLYSLKCIGGNLLYEDFSLHACRINGNDNLTNLTGLESLVTIKGPLAIYSNSSLVNLNGLDNLTIMHSPITISNNDALQSFDGLTSLFFADELGIYGNDALTNLDGLNFLASTIDLLTIGNNSSLIDLSGITNVEEINNRLFIDDNASLQTLTGLENLDEVGTLLVEDNVSLSSLNGLEGLRYIDASCIIRDNDALVDMTGLNNLRELNYGGFIIADNDGLINLNGLESLTVLNGTEEFTNNSISIAGNSALLNLEGLNSLYHVIGNVEIRDNANLVNSSDWPDLEIIGGALIISNNNAIENLESFPSLAAIAGDLVIKENDALLDLSGMESIEYLGGDLKVKENSFLQNLSALDSIETFLANVVEIDNNPELSLCAFSALCNFILEGGIPDIENNGSGCNTTNEILQSCFEGVGYTSVVGQIFADINQNCEQDSVDFGLSNFLINGISDDYNFVLSSDSLGNYWFPAVEGDWIFNVAFPSPFWQSCVNDTLVYASGASDTINIDFPFKAFGDCPYLEWSITSGNLRSCFSTTYVVDYCNYGTQSADDASYTISLDSFLTFIDASIPYTINGAGDIEFELDTLEVFNCGQFSFDVMVDCDSLELGDVQCVEAELVSDALCAPDSNWDGSLVKLSGTCENDSIYFEFENIGTGNMIQAEQFRVEIIIDDIVLLLHSDEYQLDSGEDMTLSYEVQGLGLRLEADQTPDHPFLEEASIVVPSCDNDSNNIILTLIPSDSGDPFYQSYCREITGSFDPNAKSASPVGVGINHEIEKNWTLDYLVQFQNTGTDTAFLVVIKDTLSQNLDLTTLKIKGSSHPFTWALNPENELAFTFENILLPDSTTNEPASHGFVKFSVEPKRDLLPGDLIENRVGIYFDFNDPIITNTVFHTIRKPVLASSEHVSLCVGEEYNGIEIWQDTSFQTLTEFVEYDSIHFVHLDVFSLVEDTLIVEVVIGDYFENILIQEDTIFTQSYESQSGCDSLITYLVGALTSLNHLTDFKNVNVFPNPVDNVLIVLNHENNEIQYWQLVNELGISVWKKELSVNERMPEISTENLPSGIYWLQVKTETSTAVWKIVKR